MQRVGTTPETYTNTNEQILQRGRRAIAGGDSSTMRVLPYHLPLVASHGRGSRVWDVDGNEYVDLNMAFGPLLFGHCPEHVVAAVTDQITNRGSQLGFPTEITISVAEKIQKLYPNMELLRFANSGTEADVSATRLARAFTGPTDRRAVRGTLSRLERYAVQPLSRAARRIVVRERTVRLSPERAG